MRANESSALSRWRRPSAAAGLSAAVLILTAACAAGSTSAGGGSASTARSTPTSSPLSPGQALLAAATQAQRVTSATETLDTTSTGASSSSTAGTIWFQLKPTLISEDLSVTASGTTTQIRAIVTGTALYLNEAALTSQVGKPWIKLELSQLSALGTSGAAIAKLVQDIQGNNFTAQARLSAIAKDAHVVGTRVVDGVPTTEYAGSITGTAAVKALPADLRQVLAPELQLLGNSPIHFTEWIDAQHHVRKVVDVEEINGDTITTTINITNINQPVNITLPPASQTYVSQ